MELTPEIRPDEVDFRTAFRGYEREQVDAFLERVTAAISQLRERVAKAEQAAELAEASPGSAESATVATVEAAHRTLLMAQRTADEAVREAREEADRCVEEARAEASRLEADSVRRFEQAQAEAKRVTEAAEADAVRVTDDAAADAARITSEATTAAEEHRHQTEVEVQATADKARGLLNAEIDALTHDRAVIRNDLELLDRHLVAQGQTVLGTLAELTRVLEDPTRLRVGLPEGLSGDAGAETPSSPVVEEVSEWAPDNGQHDRGASDEPSAAEPVGVAGSSGEGLDQGADLPLHADVHASGEAVLVEPDGHAVDDVDGDGDDSGTTAANAEADVEAVRWELDDDLAGDGGEHPDFWKTVAEQSGRTGLSAEAAARDDDAFLVDVRQAVTDGEAEADAADESSERISSGFDDGDLSGRPRKGFGRRR